MKPINYILICFLIALSLRCYSQDEKKEPAFYYWEIYGSVNKTTLSKDSRNESRLGYGVGARGYFLNDSKVNVVLGIEYNLTSVFIKYYNNTHFSSIYNVEANISCISMPLSVQINFGNKPTVFIEAGFYIDMNTWTNVNGTSYSGPPYQTPTTDKFEGKGHAGVIYLGPSGGIGIKIPINERALILRSEYKFGLKANNGPYHGTFESFKNRNFRIIAGIMF